MARPGAAALLVLCGLLAAAQLGAAARSSRRHLAQASPPPPSACVLSGLVCACSKEEGVEYQGGDLMAPDGNLITAKADVTGCCIGCSKLSGCYAYTVKDGLCYFKGATNWVKVPGAPGTVSGTVLNKAVPPAVGASPAPAMSPPSAPWAGAPSPAPGPEVAPSPPLVAGPSPPVAAVPSPPAAAVPSPPPLALPTAPGCVAGPKGTCTCWEEPNVEYTGADLTDASGNLITTPQSTVATLGACCAACTNITGCGAWTLKSGVCYFKQGSGWTKTNSTGVVSGTLVFAPPPARKLQ